MKKYNRLIGMFLLAYLIAAGAAAVWMAGERENADQYYLVEANRIYLSLSKEEDIDKLSLDSYQTVQKVSFLSSTEISKGALKTFY